MTSVSSLALEPCSGRKLMDTTLSYLKSVFTDSAIYLALGCIPLGTVINI